jgi:pimeloyl-ACP methyl ester carboxylesterase
MDLHFVDDGQVGKPPLLLVHGFLTSHRHWEPNLALRGRFRLIRVDLPGHGNSPVPVGEITPDRLVGALDRLRVRLDIQQWHVCGQSFGAGLTLRYALDHPENTIAQVFTNANAVFSDGWPEARVSANAARISMIDEDGAEGLVRLPFHPRFARRLPCALRQMLEGEASRVDPVGFRRLLAEALPRLSVRHRIGSTAVPTLLVNGSREKSFQPIRGQIPSMLPNARIVDLDGGHSINLERPKSLIQKFMRHGSILRDVAS